MQIASTYGKNAAAKIDYRDGKMYLTIAPAAGETTPKTRRYDWDKKKNFKLERNELVAMRYVMETALKKGVQEAQRVCESLFGKDKKNCLFIHVTDHGQAFGGVELSDRDAGTYAPFNYRITFYSKAQQGKEDTLRVGMTRINAMSMIRDIDLFTSEYFRNRLAAEMLKEKSEAQQYGADPCPDDTPGI